MWLFLVPLIVAEIAFWIALIYFAWRAFKAFRNGNLPSMTVWLCLIAVPFIFYFYKHLEADLKEVARADAIAALPRASMSQSYPKLLEVHGHATEFELLIFLDVLKFSEVVVFQRPRKGEIYGQFVTLVPACKGLGMQHMKTWEKRGRFSAPKQSDKDCLITEWKNVSDKRANIPAVEYRQGTQSALVPRGTNWASGAYEVSVRTDDGTKLINYWERPYITRPSWPGPWGYAYPANSDSKKYKQPKRLDFILNAMGDNGAGNSSS